MGGRAPNLDANIFTIDDLETFGTAKLPKSYAQYYNEGSMDLIALRENVTSYNKWRIRPRVLRNVENVDLSTEIFGTTVRLPFGLAPTAMHKLAHPDGELATSRAAAKAGIPMCLSGYANTSLEDVIKAGGSNPYTLQTTLFNNRDLTKALLKRAEKAGYKAAFVTVDLPTLGRRLNEMRNDFSLPDDINLPNIEAPNDEILRGTNKGVAVDPRPEWDELVPWLRKHTSMQIWLKGIMTVEDVEMAIAHKVDGIIISNHGGRQLDAGFSTLDVLEECAAAAKGKIGIAFDGGIRRGSDIFKAFALGAEYCFIGRAVLWGLAHNGQAGVELAIEMLRQELLNTMKLAGCKSMKDITRNHVRSVNAVVKL